MNALSRHGDWVVTWRGIENTHPRHAYYFIERGRVWELDWVRHMAEKVWVNVDDFAAALHAAQSRWPQVPTCPPAAHAA